MKKHLTLLLTFSFLFTVKFANAQSCIIDQINSTGSAGQTWSPSISIGQSFTCGNSGNLSQVSVTIGYSNFASCQPSDVIHFYLNIHLVNDAGPVIGTSNIISFAQGSFNLYNFTFSGVNLTSGNVYYFEIAGNYDCLLFNPTVNSSGSNLYSGGSMFVNGVANLNNDIIFSTCMTPPSSYNFHDPNFFIQLP